MAKRAVRIAGASGAATDRRHVLAEFARNHPSDPVDVVVQDFMSEYNMTAAAARRVDRSLSGDGNASDRSANRPTRPGYEPTFLEALEPALLDIARHNIKVVANAGVADTEALYRAVIAMMERKRVHLKVAWISGDEVLHTVKEELQCGAEFRNIYTGEALSQWQFEPIYAQAYLGGMGIAAALDHGADIVLCGRVSDASLLIGAACWWHRWSRSDLDKLANAFVAGHLIECSTYVAGGNFTGFKQLENAAGGWEDIGFPIAEISSTGEVVITKQSCSTNGAVTVDTCSAQLLYEIQGPIYLNSDVTAILDEVYFEQLAVNRVALRGVKADLPPPTTKVGITARGGYQAEAFYYMVGLDIPAKARMLESQIRRLLYPHSKHFTSLTFSILGACVDDPPDQNSATTTFRILAQAPRAEHLTSKCFVRPVIDCVMQSYPGATFNLDLRHASPRPIFEYYVTLIPQASINHKAHLPWLNASLSIDLPPSTKLYPPKSQPSTNTAITSSQPGGTTDFGPTTRGPLGWLVHARSGDKGPDANCGFWVRTDAEYLWLRNLLTTHKVKDLLGKEWRDDGSMGIERFELPRLRGVHFLFRNLLDRGVGATVTVDFLGKNVAEYLRAKWVELPDKFLHKGRL
ncbi:hypothetical protein McanMca71_000459 [Microsporum canis]|uniref:DUF1446 domain-containing protein n=1 Tax=Arthroderma otae (strain ATCC MYA-4605 / CBS 113480) TaxID=554155 RepID=C5FKB8_ARTOC|nr:DUF1446 domain-containing protein [Microsporum canis CBS 113480]EEQ30140.1 DUF1446 domain-containing protein [Microsporum canis CBS 113480]